MGFFNCKYLFCKGDFNIGDQNLINLNNYWVICYVDVLLMVVEVLNWGNIDDELVCEYLNCVCCCVFGDMDYEISVSGGVFIDFILVECCLELVGEGYCFFDFVCMGWVVEVIEGFQEGKYELFFVFFEEI